MRRNARNVFHQMQNYIGQKSTLWHRTMVHNQQIRVEHNEDIIECIFR